MRTLLLLLGLAIVSAACSHNPPEGTEGLASTSWQLVQFTGGDGKVVRPADPRRYTISFLRDGRVNANVDCNRGTSSWSSPGPNALTLGPLGLTKMYCGPDSLHDRITRDWEYVRSYMLRDGKLYIALMADAGIYEFDRLRGNDRTVKGVTVRRGIN